MLKTRTHGRFQSWIALRTQHRSATTLAGMEGRARQGMEGCVQEEGPNICVFQQGKTVDGPRQQCWVQTPAAVPSETKTTAADPSWSGQMKAILIQAGRKGLGMSSGCRGFRGGAALLHQIASDGTAGTCVQGGEMPHSGSGASLSSSKANSSKEEGALCTPQPLVVHVASLRLCSTTSLEFPPSSSSSSRMTWVTCVSGC
jgi:hypothetical protein